jgi:predicted MFS family arabinose efflux permease
MLSGIMMELWGRRRAVQISVSCLCIGCFLIAISYTYPPLLVGTAVCAFGIGASIPGIFVSKKQRNKRNKVKM